jgi:hypothetical protein
VALKDTCVLAVQESALFELPEIVDAELLRRQAHEGSFLFKVVSGSGWDAAEAAFAEVSRLLPAAGPAGVYLARCARFRASPPPEGWDGRFTLSQK